MGSPLEEGHSPPPLIHGVSGAAVEAVPEGDQSPPLIYIRNRKRKIMRKKESAEKIGYSGIFDSFPDMAIIIDAKNYNIVDANKVFLEKQALKKEKIIGRRCYEVTHKRTSPCCGPNESCPMRETIRTHKAATKEHIHYDKHNNPYYAWITTTFINDRPTKKGLVLHISRSGPFVKKFNQLIKEKSAKYIRELKKLIIKDPLTGVYNYRYLIERVSSEAYRAKRYDCPFSLAIVDIDYFKSINDAYGHRVGDEALVAFASFLKKLLRQSDILARYGGEEFVVLMANTNYVDAQRVADRILDKINSHIFKLSGLTIRVKVSIGIASLFEGKDIDDQYKLLNAADHALQRAKNSGGNTAVSYSALYKEKKRAASKVNPKEEVDVLKKKIQRLSERVDRVVLESIYAFSKSLEARDYYTAEHTDKMVTIVLRIGKALGLNQELLNNLERGAMLHDIGKIGISDSILRKKGKLTPEEYMIIKLHPKIGAEIIRSIHFLKDIVPIVLHHHERWDGQGYPSGLKGEEIPLLARIVSIGDAYQALTSDRPYRKAYSKKEALEILKEESGVFFDRNLVDVLLRLESNGKKKFPAATPRG